MLAAPGAPDLREPIAGALEDRGLFVRELTRITPTLEALFVHLIDQAGAGAPEPERPAESAAVPA